MQHAQLTFENGFRVGPANANAQGAVMVVGPGGREGGPDNRHGGADQWLYVVEGDGRALIDDRVIPLAIGTLVLIEAGEAHTIENTGAIPLKTVSIYVPPAYDREGNELPAGKP